MRLILYEGRLVNEVGIKKRQLKSSINSIIASVFRFALRPRSCAGSNTCAFESTLEVSTHTLHTLCRSNRFIPAAAGTTLLSDGRRRTQLHLSRHGRFPRWRVREAGEEVRRMGDEGDVLGTCVLVRHCRQGCWEVDGG